MDAEQRIAELSRRLAQVVNATSDENQSNTPDMLLGDFLVAVLDAGHRLITKRDLWYGGFRHPAKHRAVPESARGQAGEGEFIGVAQGKPAAVAYWTKRCEELTAERDAAVRERDEAHAALALASEAVVAMDMEALRAYLCRSNARENVRAAVAQSARLRAAAVRLAEEYREYGCNTIRAIDAIRDICALVGEEAV